MKIYFYHKDYHLNIQESINNNLQRIFKSSRSDKEIKKRYRSNN